MIARRKFDELPTVPLFEMKPTDRRNRGESAKRARVYGWTKCPECQAHERVAVVNSGTHMVYREHTFKTWGSAAMTCRASGVPLCQLPPRPYVAENAITGCAHA